MKYTIDSDISEKKGLTLQEAVALLAIHVGVTGKQLKNLEDKNAIKVLSNSCHKTYYILEPYKQILEDVLISSEEGVPEEEEVIDFIEKLRLTFPEGKKAGTPYYWRGNRTDIATRIRNFYKKYGNKYTEKQILDAAANYVNSFSGNYHFMRLLKYFIWKKENGEEMSELATYIDNEGQEETSSWLDDLR